MAVKSKTKTMKRIQLLDPTPSDKTVLELGRERVATAFDRFDHIAVMFSGGKDSTCVLHLAYDEHVKRYGTEGKQLDVIFFDEEAIPYETEDYVRDVASWPGVAMRWYCIPVRHVNACSPDEPHWYPWAPEVKDLWTRPMPPEGEWINNFPIWDFAPVENRLAMPELNALLFTVQDHGTVGLLMGIRADESMTRRRSVLRRKEDNWIVPFVREHYEMCRYPGCDFKVATPTSKTCLEHRGRRLPSQDVTDIHNVFKCQPPETRVLVVASQGGSGSKVQWEEKDLADVREGDLVVTYKTERAAFMRNGRRVYGVHHQQFDGELVVAEAAGRRSRYTPEHICVVGRLGEAFTGYHVYLMRRGNSYRVGMCKAWAGNSSGVAARVKTEGGDAAWILSRHETKDEARLEEMRVQWKFGLPGLVFNAGACRLTQEQVSGFWSEIGDLTPNAIAVLNAHGRDIRFPFWEPGGFAARHKSKLIRACNLMDGMELVLVHDDPSYRKVERAAISVTRERYEGEVISLGVEGEETYIADGFATHNCYPIYDWVTADVWTFAREYGKHPVTGEPCYNTGYDLLEMTGLPHSRQRCAPPYGNEPMTSLWTFKTCFPELWDKMCERVAGAATAARYASGPLYSHGERPRVADADWWDDRAWLALIKELLENHEEEPRKLTAKRIKIILERHNAKTAHPKSGAPDHLLPDIPHPVTGLSWQFLAMVAMRGDPKQRKNPEWQVAQRGDPKKLGQIRQRYIDGVRQKLDWMKTNSAERGT